MGDRDGVTRQPLFQLGRELLESGTHNYHSNCAAQWSLSVIESLALTDYAREQDRE